MRRHPVFAWTPAAALYQRRYVARLVATGQWAGPRPSDQVMELAVLTTAGQSACALAA